MTEHLLEPCGQLRPGQAKAVAEYYDGDAKKTRPLGLKNPLSSEIIAELIAQKKRKQEEGQAAQSQTGEATQSAARSGEGEAAEASREVGQEVTAAGSGSGESTLLTLSIYFYKMRFSPSIFRGGISLIFFYGFGPHSPLKNMRKSSFFMRFFIFLWVFW